MDEEYFLENFVCSITRQPINLIGITSDGKTYEKTVIEQWLKNHDTSPLTGLKIDKKVYNCSTTQNILDNFYKKFPDYQKKRYQKSTLHCDNVEEINDIIRESKFTDLPNYTEFDWLLFEDDNITKIVKSCDTTSFKYLIDNTLNLEAIIDTDMKWRAIHYACRYGSSEIIKLLFEKNVDLECESANKWRPIHHACRRQSIETIKLFVDKNVDLEAETIDKWRPIHYACRYRSAEIINLLISKGVNCDSKIADFGGKKCNYGIVELIKLNDNIQVPK